MATKTQSTIGAGTFSTPPPIHEYRSIKPRMVEAVTQTEKKDVATMTEPSTSTAVDPFSSISLITQMSIMIVKLLKLKSLEDSREVVNTVNSVMGITLTESDISSQLEDSPLESESDKVVGEEPFIMKPGKRKMLQPELGGGAKAQKTDAGGPSKNLRSNLPKTQQAQSNKKENKKNKNKKIICQKN